MSRSDKKNGVMALLRRKSVLAVNIVLALLIAWGFAGEFMRSRGMQDEIDRLQEQAAALEVRNLQLAEMAGRFSASSALEREARMKLNMMKPGEEVVVVRETEAIVETGREDGAGGGDEAKEESSVISNVRKWIDHFFPRNKSQ